jgi:hypothetical protein
MFTSPDIRADRKARGLLQAIATSPQRDGVEARYVGAVRMSDLPAVLAEHRPDILHLIVHGAGDILAFEDWSGGLAKLGSVRLAAIIGEAPSIRLVCLEACRSRRIAEAIAGAGPAGRRPLAVGMHFDLPSSAGDRFYVPFYQGLLATGRVDLAFADGRRALELAGDRDHVLPALICPEGQAAATSLLTPWPLRAAPVVAAPLEVEVRGSLAARDAPFVGREAALRRLDECWGDPGLGAVWVHGPAGAGKTTLVREWLRRVRGDGWRNASRVRTWSLASDGDVRLCFAALEPAPPSSVRAPSCAERDGLRLAARLRGERALLVIDDVEALPRAGGGERPALHPALAGLLRGLADGGPGLCVLVSRAPLGPAPGVAPLRVEELPPADAAELLWRRGVVADPATLAGLAAALGALPGALALATGPRPADDDAVAALRRRVQAEADAPPLTRAWRSLPPLSAAARRALRDAAERGGEVRPHPDVAPALRELARAGLVDVDVELRGRVAQPAVAELALAELPAAEPAAAGPSAVAQELAALRTAESASAVATDVAARRPGAPSAVAPDFAALRPVLAEIRRAVRAGAAVPAARRYIAEVCGYDPARYQWSRIARQFVAVAEDLELLAGLFAAPWTTLRPALVAGLPAHDQGYLLHRAALALRHLGRIAEALPAMAAAQAVFAGAGRRDRAAICANDRAELLVLLGREAEATTAVVEALAIAGDDPHALHLLHALHGHLLARAGDRAAAAGAFAEATRQVARVAAAMQGTVARSERLASRPGLYHFEHRLGELDGLPAADAGPAIAALVDHLVDAYWFHLHASVAPHSQAYVWLGWGKLAALCARRGLAFPGARAWELFPDPSALAEAVAAGSDDPPKRALGVIAELFLTKAVTVLHEAQHAWMLPLALLPRAEVRAALLDDRVHARLDVEEALAVAGADDMPTLRREALALRERLVR